MSKALLRLELLKTKAVYITGIPTLREWATAMLPSGTVLTNSISESEMLLVLDAGNWLSDETVLADINNACSAGKPWALLSFGLNDLVGICDLTPKNTPRHRRVNRSLLRR